MAGKVYLVGAGPGDPELLTLKALRLLKTADIVLHDDLVGRDVLRLVPSTVQLKNVGKRCGEKRISQEEINALLVNYALLDLQVVRLKSGDPLVFGRAGEEIEAMRRAGVACEVVPGVTAALGAAASAQVPLTYREMSSSVTLLTNHHKNDSDTESWIGHIPVNGTLVVYMPGSHYERTAQKLLLAGMKQSTPCAIISHATSGDQQVHVTTIADLASSPQLPAPTLLVVGEVVRLAAKADLKQQFRPEALSSPVAVVAVPVVPHIPSQELSE